VKEGKEEEGGKRKRELPLGIQSWCPSSLWSSIHHEKEAGRKEEGGKRKRGRKA
jgi:hypothetical protein